eukprot:12382704-Karenia_brevis.AAC.1
MELEEPPAASLQLPKIGGLANTGSTVVVLQAALGQRPKIQYGKPPQPGERAISKPPPQLLVQA